MPLGHYDYQHDPRKRQERVERARKAAAASHTPDAYIRALARATLTDAHRAALTALLADQAAAGNDGEGEAA
jgi:hypothetical protein